MELVLDQLAARIAMAEVEAGRQAEVARQWKERALMAEDTLVQLRESLGHARRLGQAG
ncbi:hypothetical protein [Pseudoroseomonas ludipueritiae]|uniref:Uncharacterized protein n=1 Tax=Pseudoroseomonas ludipueritiae TaxID=198093 RepID=A0ABR7R6T5_9PROT|nr:hypothetical protein [Pseudoroseomonas ludipueritiae]MBC9177345.1 hypothetical protein [Pseudoroseomonas ludipueritiae]